MYSVTLWPTKVNPGLSRNAAMLSAEPVMKLSMPTTSAPPSSRNSQRWEPMKPAAPVTRTRIRSGGQGGLAADGVVLEAEPAHPLRLPEVAPVEDQRAPQRRAQSLEIEELELVPFRHQRHGVGAGGRLVRRLAVRHAGGQYLARVVGGHRVVRAHAGAALHEPRDDLDRLRLAHVVGVRLERQTEDGDHAAFHRVQRLLHQLHEM